MPDPSPTPAPAPAAASRSVLSPLLIVRLAVEAFALFSFAFWGFTAWPFAWNILVGIAAPVVAILVWGLFVSPKAVVPVHPFIRAAVELLVFAAVTVVWWTMGQVWVGLAFAVVAVTSGVLVGRQRLS